MDRLPHRQPNRYLEWLDQGGAPPVRGSLPKAQEAARLLARRCTGARARLAMPQAGWEAFDAFLAAQQALRALVALVEEQSSVSKRLTPAKAGPWVRRWRAWQDRFTQAVAGHPAARTLERLGAGTACPHRLRQLELLAKAWECDPALEADMRRQEAAQERRTERHALDRLVRGGVLAGGTVPGVRREYHAVARKKARERGLEGYLFYPGTEEAEAACNYAEHPELRRLLWLEDQYAPVPMPAVDRMRATRRASAQARGSRSWAHLRFDSAMVLEDPDKLLGHIQRARAMLRRESDAFRAACRDQARAQGLELAKGQLPPWDEFFCSAMCDTGQWTDLKRVFPWRETTLKALPELLEAAGWQPDGPVRVSGEGLWSVVQATARQRETGRRIHLLYSPFRPHQKGHSYSAGQASDIINHWNAPGSPARPTVVWINQTLDPKDQSFSFEDLRVLCHEVGHALHFASMPGHNPWENDHIPEDLVEVPSHLLELYFRDPNVLARWASRKGPEAARRSRYWVRKLAWDRDSAVDHQIQLRCAMVDLVAHLDMGRPFADIARQAMVEDGLSMFPEDNAWRRDFIWQNEQAGVDFAQTLPRSLARRLVTMPDTGHAHAPSVAAAYRALVSQVLIPGTTAKAARRCWKKWTKESFSASVGLALATHARQSTRITRKATQALRKKTADKRKKAR